MKSMEYINWDNLKNIPFSLCEVKDDLENRDIDIFYQGERVLHDDDHTIGYFLRSAIMLFNHVRRKNADWLNLDNLWTLRCCIRVHCYHGLGIDSLLYGENFSGDLSTLSPLTKARFEKIRKLVIDMRQSMKVIVGIIISREFSMQYMEYHPRFGAHRDAIDTFHNLLSKGLPYFKSDLVETICIDLICLSPMFSQFFKPQRPKYYEDRTLKCRGSVTPEVRMYKCLTADFVVDFESYIKLNSKEECLNYLALSFLDFLKNLKYPGKLKKFEQVEFLQAVRELFIMNSFLSVGDGI